MNFGGIFFKLSTAFRSKMVTVTRDSTPERYEAVKGDMFTASYLLIVSI